MKIHDRIYVIGGGDNSFGLSHALDCTVYFLDGGSEGVIIDSGGGIDSALILENLQTEGFTPACVSKILLTHAHADHCAGAAYLSEQCAAPIFAGTEAADFLNRRDLTAMSIGAAIESGVYPRGYIFPDMEAHPLQDGDIIQVGDLNVRVVSLPGHSDGHVGFYLEYEGKRILFSGDLVFGKAKISLQKTWDCRLQPYFDSLRKAYDMRIDTLLTGHQAFCMNGAHRILERVLSPGCTMPGNL